MRTSISTIILVCLIFLCGSSFADEIVFTNGERLIGKFERMEEGKLIFKSQLVGEVKVDLSHVSHISTDTPFDIHLLDGTVLKSKTFKSEADRFTIDGTAESQEQTFALSTLSALNPLPKPKVKWSGSITAGFTSSHGSSFSENLNIDGDLNMRTEKHRFWLNSRFVLERNKDDNGDKKTTEENFTVSGTYSYYFTEKFFGYLNERFKKDHIDNLDYRITSVPGVGYQWIDTDKLQFSTQGGVGLLQEKYTSRVPDPTGEKVWTKEVDRKEDLIIQIGYHFAWKLNDKFSFVSNLAHNPSADDFSDYNLTHDSEVRAFITQSLYCSFKFILDYDSSPGEDSASTDTDYILGFGWRF